MGVALRSSVRRYNFVEREERVAVLKPNLSLSVFHPLSQSFTLLQSFSLILPLPPSLFFSLFSNEAFVHLFPRRLWQRTCISSARKQFNCRARLIVDARINKRNAFISGRKRRST